MTDLENIKEIWMGLDQKLERNWKLNVELLRRSNLDKATSKMRSLLWVKSIGLVFYVVSAFFFLYFAISNWAVMHMAGAGMLLTFWTAAICMASIHELDLISKIDFSEPVTISQKKLNRLRLAIIKYLRLGIWIMPLYFTFIIIFFKVAFNLDIVAIGDVTWIWSNALFSVVVFLPLAIWGHRMLSPKNAEKKWMNALLRGNGSQITDALSFIGEIEEFEKEDKN